MPSSCRRQSELGPVFGDLLHLTVLLPFVPAIVVRVQPWPYGPYSLDVIPTFLPVEARQSVQSALYSRRGRNRTRGLRSLRDLTQHLTTRADDSHAAPLRASLRKSAFTDGRSQFKPG